MLTGNLNNFGKCLRTEGSRPIRKKILPPKGSLTSNMKTSLNMELISSLNDTLHWEIWYNSEKLGAFLYGTPEQSQSRAHSDSSQPSWPEFQINVESFDLSSTLLDSSWTRAEARVRRVGTLVEPGSKLLTFLSGTLVYSRNSRSFSWNSRFLEFDSRFPEIMAYYCNKNILLLFRHPV